MTKRIVLAGLVGGLVLFAWSSFSHTVLPIGTMGLSTLANEEPVVEALRDHIPADGLYYFPGMAAMEAGRETQEAWEAKVRRGPSGMLLIQAGEGSLMSPWQLVIELLTNLLAGILVAWLLWWLHVRPVPSGFLAALLGFLSWLNISASHWNWYRFPSAFVMAELIDQIIGWFLAGLVIAALLWRSARRVDRKAIA